VVARAVFKASAEMFAGKAQLWEREKPGNAMADDAIATEEFDADLSEAQGRRGRKGKLVLLEGRLPERPVSGRERRMLAWFIEAGARAAESPTDGLVVQVRDVEFIKCFEAENPSFRSSPSKSSGGSDAKDRRAQSAMSRWRLLCDPDGTCTVPGVLDPDGRAHRVRLELRATEQGILSVALSSTEDGGEPKPGPSPEVVGLGTLAGRPGVELQLALNTIGRELASLGPARIGRAVRKANRETARKTPGVKRALAWLLTFAAAIALGAWVNHYYFSPFSLVVVVDVERTIGGARDAPDRPVVRLEWFDKRGEAQHYVVERDGKTVHQEPGCTAPDQPCTHHWVDREAPYPERVRYRVTDESGHRKTSESEVNWTGLRARGFVAGSRVTGRLLYPWTLLTESRASGRPRNLFIREETVKLDLGFVDKWGARYDPFELSEVICETESGHRFRVAVGKIDLKFLSEGSTSFACTAFLKNGRTTQEADVHRVRILPAPPNRDDAWIRIEPFDTHAAEFLRSPFELGALNPLESRPAGRARIRLAPFPNILLPLGPTGIDPGVAVPSVTTKGYFNFALTAIDNQGQAIPRVSLEVDYRKPLVVAFVYHTEILGCETPAYVASFGDGSVEVIDEFPPTSRPHTVESNGFRSSHPEHLRIDTDSLDRSRPIVCLVHEYSRPGIYTVTFQRYRRGFRRWYVASDEISGDVLVGDERAALTHDSRR
jgi:hypothetical protein